MEAPAPPRTARGRKCHRTAPGFGQSPSGRRVAVYLRRSTDDEHQPFAITAQQTALTRYVSTQPGWTLVSEYSDDASGAATSRPGLQAALRAARDGRYDTLLVYRVDRFSRRLSDLLDLLGELDQAGVTFASATEPFDTSTSIGRMLVQLLGVFAEFERETIIDRVTAGMNAKAAKGKWPGGRLPYGYQRDPATHKLVPDPAQAPVVRDIFRLYTRDRLGTRAIAAQLNARGLRTRPGKPWSGHVIGLMLANPAYAGDITRGDIRVPDAHEPLISRQTFAQAARIAASRSGQHQQRAAKPARPPASPPARPTPPSWPPCASSTASSPPSSAPPSPQHRPATPPATTPGKPNWTPWPPRSAPSRPPPTATTRRSRTAPWTTPPPGPGSATCTTRSPPAATNSPTSSPASRRPRGQR
jgi:site-specific DNA recombinase